MELALIYARSENRCIGRDGRIPWRLPDEFKHFKQTTLGHPIVMGRKTYQDHDSALPGRLNLVITRQSDLDVAEGIETASSLDEALGLAGADHELAFVIGGVGLFEQALPRAGRVYETVIHAEVEGDTFLPDFDFSDWQTTELQHHDRDDRHAHAYTCYLHRRPVSATPG